MSRVNAESHKEVRQFYTVLAEDYDDIYHFIDYEAQSLGFVRLLGKYGRSGGKEVMDLGCGTGVHLAILRRLGYNVSGMDISEEMLAVAKRNVPGAAFSVGDLRDMHVEGKVDLVLCFFNTILYSRPTSSLRKTLRNIFAMLKPGGITIFDLVDKSIGIDSAPQEFNSERDGREIKFCPQWIYSGEGEVIDLVIEFTVSERQRVTRFRDHHVMCAVSIDEVRRWLIEAGFEAWCLEKDFVSFRSWTGESKRVMLVARRPL